MKFGSVFAASVVAAGSPTHSRQPVHSQAPGIIPAKDSPTFIAHCRRLDHRDRRRRRGRDRRQRGRGRRGSRLGVPSQRGGLDGAAGGEVGGEAGGPGAVIRARGVGDGLRDRGCGYDGGGVVFGRPGERGCRGGAHAHAGR